MNEGFKPAMTMCHSATRGRAPRSRAGLMLAGILLVYGLLVGCAGVDVGVNSHVQTRVAPTFEIDSDGGTFASHVLFNAPESFDQYIIGSPVLSWDDDLLFRDEERLAKGGAELPVTVFLSVGELEIENGIREPTERMMKILASRGYEGLTLKTHVFPDETHESVLPATASRGLRAVFGAWP